MRIGLTVPTPRRESGPRDAPRRDRARRGARSPRRLDAEHLVAGLRRPDGARAGRCAHAPDRAGDVRGADVHAPPRRDGAAGAAGRMADGHWRCSPRWRGRCGDARGTSMEPRLGLITLGVADVARSRRFYEALGWRASGASQADVTFFQLGGMVLSLSPARRPEDAEARAQGGPSPSSGRGALGPSRSAAAAARCGATPTSPRARSRGGARRSPRPEGSVTLAGPAGIPMRSSGGRG